MPVVVVADGDVVVMLDAEELLPPPTTILFVRRCSQSMIPFAVMIHEQYYLQRSTSKHLQNVKVID